jgi:hypothetical protein
MHVYLWTQFILFVIASIGMIAKYRKFGGGSNLFTLVANIGMLIWTAILIWS